MNRVSLQNEIVLRRVPRRVTKRGFGECRQYTPESIELVNAALQAGAKDVNEALAKISAGVDKSALTRIKRERESLMHGNEFWELMEEAKKRNIKGRWKMRKADLVAAILRSKYNPLNVTAALLHV